MIVSADRIHPPRDAEHHVLPKPTWRRYKAQSVHRCSCGKFMVVGTYQLDTFSTGYRWVEADGWRTHR
jgi:hypothetical protein